MSKSLQTAKKTAVALSRAEGVTKAIGLLHRINREIPKIITLYNIEKHPQELRKAVVDLFRLQKDVTDPRIIDILVMKGQLQFEEVMLQHTSKMHIYDILWPSELAQDTLYQQRRGKSFMDDFYRGL